MHAGNSIGLMAMLAVGLMLIAGCSTAVTPMQTAPAAPAASADAPSAPAGGFSLAAGDALGASLFMGADAPTATAIARND
ncbi:MAG: hypothetical protein GX591_02575 [Planctomycetes bacterium]|nr:hypothetical protein [Planctomycetota bacterium]